MRYYKDAGIPVGEIITPAASVVESARQAEIAKVRESQEFKEGDVIEAKVTKINSGNRVTYEILGVIKLTEKEPKKASVLKEGQIVNVKIVALKEDGSIKSVKCI
jgi:exosome complex RNA-binding protein Rrp4